VNVDKIALIREKTKKIPFFNLSKDSSQENTQSSYDSYYETYKNKLHETLRNLFYEDDGLFIFNNEEEIKEDNKITSDKTQNGILFSSYIKKHDSEVHGIKRDDIFYKGIIWDDENHNEMKDKFIYMFSILKKENFFKRSLVDFLLYEEKLLIPSILKVRSVSVDEKKYKDIESSFGNLYLPIYNNDIIKNIFNTLNLFVDKYIRGRFTSVEDIEKEQVSYKELEENINKLKNHVEKEYLEDLKKNFENAGITLEGVSDEMLVNASIMHHFSIYAKNIIIFSSGTYKNISGLVFACHPKGNNWENIEKYEKEIQYLDSSVRRITQADIHYDEDVAKELFFKAYDDRLYKYKILENIVKAQLISLLNGDQKDIRYDDIQSRIKTKQSLLKKIYSKEEFKKLFKQRKYDKLFSENKNKIYCNCDNGNSEENEDYSVCRIYSNDGPIDSVLTDEINIDHIINANDKEVFSVDKIGTRNKEKDLKENTLYYKNRENNIDEVYFSTFQTEGITDFCGVRIIFYYYDELQKFAKLENISKYFNVYEMQDKLLINELEDGYISIHYLLSLKKEIIKAISEKVGLEDLVFELQLRTSIQHSWAIVAHELQHKNNENSHGAVLNKQLNDNSKDLHDIDKKISKIKNEINEN
jgi:ppGpp synthetase/RelA/SpoT-type nucleotidyltranferase